MRGKVRLTLWFEQQRPRPTVAAWCYAVGMGNEALSTPPSLAKAGDLAYDPGLNFPDRTLAGSRGDRTRRSRG